MLRGIFFLPFFIVFFLQAETFSERFTAFNVKPEDIFYAPVTDQEKNDYQFGLLNAWKSYSQGEAPSEMTYKGYVLFADPFHYGQHRISFLMGSDCSNFVQRLYQLLGADFPYAKTRQWLVLGQEGAAKPADLTTCQWEKLKTLFQKVAASDVQVGDIAVYGYITGDMGEHGHMGIVASLAPFRFLNDRSKAGYSLDEQDFQAFLADKNPIFFRFVGQLSPLASYSVKERLKTQYLPDNSGCN